MVAIRHDKKENIASIMIFILLESFLEEKRINSALENLQRSLIDENIFHTSYPPHTHTHIIKPSDISKIMLFNVWQSEQNFLNKVINRQSNNYYYQKYKFTILIKDWHIISGCFTHQVMSGL